MLEGGGETGVPVTEPFFAMCSETCVSLVWGNDGTLSVSGEGCKRLEIGTNSVPQSNNSRSSRGSEKFFCHALLVAYSIRINTGSEVMSKGLCPNH